MTITTQTNRIDYTANGVTTIFAYDFPITDEDDMKVYFDSVLQVGGYTVSGVGDEAGGDVTFDTAPTSGVLVSLYREVEYTQETDYQPYDPFPAEAHEAALDKLTMQCIQLYEATQRAISAPPGADPDVDYTLPVYVAGKGLMWHETNKELTNSDDDLNDIVSSAAASAAAAAASAAAASASASAASASEAAAAASEAAADASETAAAASETAAGLSETAADASELAAAASEAAAAASEAAAAASETAAAASESAAATSETNAATSETNAAASAALAATYAVQKFTETYAPTTEGSDGDLWFQYVA